MLLVSYFMKFHVASNVCEKMHSWGYSLECSLLHPLFMIVFHAACSLLWKSFKLQEVCMGISYGAGNVCECVCRIFHDWQFVKNVEIQRE